MLWTPLLALMNFPYLKLDPHRRDLSPFDKGPVNWCCHTAIIRNIKQVHILRGPTKRYCRSASHDGRVCISSDYHRFTARRDFSNNICNTSSYVGRSIFCDCNIIRKPGLRTNSFEGTDSFPGIWVDADAHQGAGEGVCVVKVSIV